MREKDTDLESGEEKLTHIAGIDAVLVTGEDNYFGGGEDYESELFWGSL